MVSVSLTDATSGVDMGSQAVGLPAGGTGALSFTWATSSATTLGAHTLTAVAAPVPGETSTADNSQTTSVSVLGRHGVAVTGIIAGPSVVQGDTAGIQVALADQGSYPESVTVGLQDVTTGTVLGSTSVGLAAGGSGTVAFVWAISGTTALGSHTLVATAAAVPGETDTSNNTGAPRSVL